MNNFIIPSPAAPQFFSWGYSRKGAPFSQTGLKPRQGGWQRSESLSSSTQWRKGKELEWWWKNGAGGAKVSFFFKKVWRLKRGAEEKDSACKVPACVTEEYNKNCDCEMNSVFSIDIVVLSNIYTGEKNKNYSYGLCV